VVILVTRGQSRAQHAGALLVRAGEIHIIPPGDPHGGRHMDDAEGWGLMFRPDALTAGWEDPTAPLLGPFTRVRSGCHPILQPLPAQRARMEHWLQLMQDELMRAEGTSPAALTSLLRLLLIDLERVAAPGPVAVPAALGLARAAVEFIEAHALEALSLAGVARALGRSSAHVAAAVRRETGQTVGEWILECRMAEARRRLRATDEHVDIIAERVGYGDVTHFIRLFRRVHGATPAAWRRRLHPHNA